MSCAVVQADLRHLLIPGAREWGSDPPNHGVGVGEEFLQENLECRFQMEEELLGRLNYKHLLKLYGDFEQATPGEPSFPIPISLCTTTTPALSVA